MREGGIVVANRLLGRDPHGSFERDQDGIAEDRHRRSARDQHEKRQAELSEREQEEQQEGDREPRADDEQDRLPPLRRSRPDLRHRFRRFARRTWRSGSRGRFPGLRRGQPRGWAGRRAGERAVSDRGGHVLDHLGVRSRGAGSRPRKGAVGGGAAGASWNSAPASAIVGPSSPEGSGLSFIDATPRQPRQPPLTHKVCPVT